MKNRIQEVSGFYIFWNIALRNLMNVIHLPLEVHNQVFTHPVTL